MIKSVAQNKKVQKYIVEKYCAMSHLLAAINYLDGLGENLVRKGSTALKKNSILRITAFLKTWIILRGRWDR